MTARIRAVSPARPTLTPGADSNGFIAWNADLIGLSAGYQPPAGTLVLVRLRIPYACPIANLYTVVQTIGATLTAGQNLMGLYDDNQTLLSATADQSTTWSGTTGLKAAALLTPQVFTGPQDVFVGLETNGTTRPNFLRGAMGWHNENLATPHLRVSTANTGLTTAMPNPFTAQTALSPSVWAAVA